MSKTLFQQFNYLKLPNFYYDQITHSNDYIYGKLKRKIYHSGFLTNNDQYIINKIKHEIIRQKMIFPHRYQYLNNDRELLKFMMATSNKTDTVIQRLKDKIFWNDKMRFFSPTPRAKSFLENGTIYLSGRDKQLRPIIIFNVNKIDLNKYKVNDPLEALMYCLEIAEKCMFSPGKVENWVVLVNLGNIGYVPKIPIKDLDKMIKDTTYYYPGCMDRVYLINPPLLVYLSWKIISLLIPSDSLQNVHLLPNFKLNELQKSIDKSQLDSELGGELKLQQYWPPINTMNKALMGVESVQKGKRKNFSKFLGRKLQNSKNKVLQLCMNLANKIELKPIDFQIDSVLKRLLCKIKQKNYQLN